MLENLFIVVEVFSIVVCLFALYGKKFELDLKTMCVILVNVIVLYMKNSGYINEMASLLLYVVIFIYCLFEFDKSIKLAIVNCVLYMTIIPLLQLISAIPLMFVRNIISIDEIIGLIVNVLVMLMIIWLRAKIEILSLFIRKKQWLSTLVITICFIMITLLLIKYKAYNVVTMDVYIIAVVLIALSVILTQKWQESQAEVEKKQLELEMSEAYNNAFETFITNIRRQQHDVNNQINAIYSMHYISSTYEELVNNQREYCNYIESNFKFNELLRINIPILGGFLYSRLQIMDSKGIKAKTDIKLYSKKLPIPTYELITILGILFDNAEEAIEIRNSESKTIVFSIIENEETLNICVKNTYDYIDNISKIFSIGYSSKGENRGIGLYNVKEKVNKYKGAIKADNELIDEMNWVSISLIFDKE